MSIPIKLLADRVLVEPEKAVSKTASGIYIPETAKEKPLKGVIVSVGNGTKDEAMELVIGDIVLYGKHAGSNINVEDNEYLIMRQADILAVIKK